MAAFEKLIDFSKLSRFLGKLRTESDDKYAKKTDTVLSTTLSMGRVANTTVGAGSTALGSGVTASGAQSHAEGYGSTASGTAAHAEGGGATAGSTYAHAEGSLTTAAANSAHAEGLRSSAIGASAHAEGAQTIAGGVASHAEGLGAEAIGSQAHAEGKNTQANGDNSHAEGEGTIAEDDNQHVQGTYNVADSSGDLIHIVGGGTSSSNRKNIHTLSIGGKAEFFDDVVAFACGKSGEAYSLAKVYQPLIMFPKACFSKASTPGTILTPSTNQSFIVILGDIAHIFVKARYSTGFAANTDYVLYQTPIVPLWTQNKDSIGYGGVAAMNASSVYSSLVYLTGDGKIHYTNKNSSNAVKSEVNTHLTVPILRIDPSLVVAESAQQTLKEAYEEWLIKGAAELCYPDPNGSAAAGGVVIDGTRPETGPFDIDELVQMCQSSGRVDFYLAVREYLDDQGRLPSE